MFKTSGYDIVIFHKNPNTVNEILIRQLFILYSIKYNITFTIQV